MAWAKLTDDFLSHPKVMAARAEKGWSAIGVYVGALTWVNQQRTDGFVPKSWVQLHNGIEEATVLVKVGLWHEDAARDGWQIHDYADYQPLKAELEAKTERKRSAGQAGGKQSASNRQANAKQNASNAEAKLKPVPVPVPVTTPKGVVSGTHKISEKESRNRKRLGLELNGGGAA